MSRESITLKRGWLAAVVAAGVAEAFFAGRFASALPAHLREAGIAVDPLVGVAADQSRFAPNPFAAQGDFMLGTTCGHRSVG